MAKSPRKDPAVLAREYIYSAEVPPISITALADKHGYARSHMADMARKGIGLTQPNGGSLKSWYEARREVRTMVGEKVLDALTDDWAATEAEIRNRLLQTAMLMLDQIDQGLAEGTIKVGAKDFPPVAAVIRTMLGDVAAVRSQPDPRLLNPEEHDIDPAKYAESLADIKQLLAGEATNGALHAATESGPAPGDASPGAEGPEQD